MNRLSNTSMREVRLLIDAISGQSRGVPFIGLFGRRCSSWGYFVSSLALAAVVFLPTKPLYSQDAIRIDEKGNVGIGTQTPTTPLDVNGDAKVNKNLSVGSQLSVGSEIKAVPAPKEGENSMASGAAIQLFQGVGKLQLRYVRTTGKDGQIDRIGFAPPNGSWMTWSEFQTNNMYIGGNLGIGTDPTAKKLTVNGDVKASGNLDLSGSLTSGASISSVGDITSKGNIKLGENGSMYASASAENLRMVRGSVDQYGNILAGRGFTVGHPHTGVYVITFTKGSFSDLPSVTASQVAVGGDSWVTDNALPGSVTKDGMTVYLGSYKDKRLDRPFSFTVMGPR
jgi:hypothetical protein